MSVNFLGRITAFFSAILVVLSVSCLSTRAAIPKDGSTNEKRFYCLQVPFIENAGQLADSSVKYYAKTFGGAVFVTEDGTITYAVQQSPTISESLVGAGTLRPKGEVKSATKVGHFTRSASADWKRNITAYDSVTVGEVYEGIELKLKAYGKKVEKLFYVRPEARPEDILLKIGGAASLRVNDAGELEVRAGAETLKFTRPVAYQMVDGHRRYVEVSYAVKGHEYGFRLGAYDRNREIVIDPVFTATVLGGHADDLIRAITVDKEGYVYVAGSTRSADFPEANSGHGVVHQGGSDAFVAKLDPSLQNLVAFTFVGGAGNEEVTALATDIDGNLYVTGFTNSAGFPATVGAFDIKYSGGTDAFVAKLDPSLQNLLSATLLGGGAEDMATTIAVDTAGNVYIAGHTRSVNLPVAHAFDGKHNGGTDAFIAKFDASLKHLVAATFLGGDRDESAVGLTIGPEGSVYVAGNTLSTNLPISSSGYSTKSSGSAEAFVAKFDERLGRLLAATLLGGSGNDEARALAVDGTGNIFVSGSTRSSNFPMTDEPYAASLGGGADVFVAKLDGALENLLAATYLGGAADEAGSALVLDGNGTVYVAGTTSTLSD